MIRDLISQRIGVALCVASFLVVVAQALEAQPRNNFATMGQLDGAAERALGVFSPPDVLQEVARVRGVPILAASDMPERLAAVEEAMRHLPAMFDAFPPRAIILSDAGLRLLSSPLATARASGSYILLGDGFFKTRGVSAIPVAERPRMLLHEWVHVLQFYYADTSRAGEFSLTTHSTLLDGWAEATGWIQVDGNWELPEARYHETTAYGRTAPIEDQADALSFVLLGHPDRVSASRVAFLEDALDLSVDQLTAGVFPHPAGAVPLRRAQGSITQMLDALVPDAPGAQLLVAEHVADIVTFFEDHAAELKRRGFHEVDRTKSEPDNRGLSTYRGEWTFDGRTALLGAVVLPRAGKSVVVLRLLEDTG